MLDPNNFFRLFGRGILAIVRTPWNAVVLAVVAVTLIAGWLTLSPTISQHPLAVSYGIPEEVVRISLAALGVVGFLMVICSFGRPVGAMAAERNLENIGLTNNANEVPRLLSKYKKENSTIFEFETCGVALPIWLKKQDEIASALNRHIVGIREGRNKRRIILETVKASRLSSSIAWNDNYIIREDFKLVLGMSHGGIVSFDLAKVPHALIGGSTGSGKTVLMKCLIHQCMSKAGCTVYIADFKGGLDFPSKWKCPPFFVTDTEALLTCLDNLVEDLEERRRAYSDLPVEIDASVIPPTCRIVLACDEIAEVLDKTGLDKDQKAVVAEIEAKLATIARTGRAFGIHLLLGTQRPDANVLAGQIKSNIDMRVCGRADEVLSRIILDSTAASRIPKDSQGRFMLADGTEFQAFNFTI